MMKRRLILGLIAMVIIMGILFMIVLPAALRARDAARLERCQSNLKECGLVLRMYANEHKEVFPALEATPGRFIFDPHDLYPKYTQDASILICPSNANAAPEMATDMAAVIEKGRSYYYLGYFVENEEQARVFLDAYRQRLREGGGFEDDLPVAPGQGYEGSDRIKRFEFGPLRGPVTDMSEFLSRVNILEPVMFDRSPDYHDNGINVLYTDGHLEFIKMEDKWPAQQWFLDALAEIDPELMPADR